MSLTVSSAGHGTLERIARSSALNHAEKSTMPQQQHTSPRLPTLKGAVQRYQKTHRIAKRKSTLGYVAAYGVIPGAIATGLVVFLTGLWAWTTAVAVLVTVGLAVVAFRSVGVRRLWKSKRWTAQRNLIAIMKQHITAEYQVDTVDYQTGLSEDHADVHVVEFSRKMPSSGKVQKIQFEYIPEHDVLVPKRGTSFVALRHNSQWKSAGFPNTRHITDHFFKNTERDQS